MNGYKFIFAGTELTMLAGGALWWDDAKMLIVSDLHLGKSERMARRGSSLMPPYETSDTLLRFERDISLTEAEIVVCLGDSFDDLDAARNLSESDVLWLARLMAGRRWVWIEGNHDPGPMEFGGTHLAELFQPPLSFRHIAKAGAAAEISGHYHPKARISLRGRSLSRPCMLYDSDRIILPAYGTYTGGLRSDDEALEGLMRQEAIAVLIGPKPQAIPMPRGLK